MATAQPDGDWREGYRKYWKSRAWYQALEDEMSKWRTGKDLGDTEEKPAEDQPAEEQPEKEKPAEKPAEPAKPPAPSGDPAVAYKAAERQKRREQRLAEKGY